MYPTKERKTQAKGEREEEGESLSHVGKCEWSVEKRRTDEG